MFVNTHYFFLGGENVDFEKKTDSKPFEYGKPLKGYFQNIKDLDEIQHNATLH